MLRSSLMLTGLVALGATAPAQQAVPTNKLHPVTSPIRDAGTYHLATQTWTRKASAANVGADTIYNNTCNSNYYSSLTLDRFIDEGRLPSPTSPNNLSSKMGCLTQYNIDGFQIGYCTDQPTVASFTVNFWESQYVDCFTSMVGVTPTAAFVLNNLPGAGAGTFGCWIVNIDLDSPPLTASLAFNMLADKDGTYTGPGAAEVFGWSIESTAPGTGTGPLIAGDFSMCAGFDGTRWDTPVNYAEDGTGMSTLQNFRYEGPALSNCAVFPSAQIPISSFWLEVYSDACVPQEPGVVFCAGDGTGTACPCQPTPGNGAAGNGCPNSLFAAGAHLAATGTASIAGDTVALVGTQMPNSSCLYFQGTTQQNGGLGSAFGDGLRCAGGTVIRLGTKTNVGNTSQYPAAGDLSVSARGMVTTPGTRTYQAWYRNAAVFCTASTFNLTNGYSIAWGA